MSETQMKQGTGKKRGRIMALAVLFLLLVLAALLWVVSRNRQEEPKYEPNVTVGDMPGKSLEAIERELQGKVDEKTISFTVNGKPVFENGGAKGSLKLDCPANNTNRLQFVITRDDNGARLYDSGVLAPGSYVDEDVLQTDAPLPAGSYACTVAITAFASDSDTVRGNTNAKITLTVLN